MLRHLFVSLHCAAGYTSKVRGNDNGAILITYFCESCEPYDLCARRGSRALGWVPSQHSARCGCSERAASSSTFTRWPAVITVPHRVATSRLIPAMGTLLHHWKQDFPHVTTSRRITELRSLNSRSRCKNFCWSSRQFSVLGHENKLSM
jgi:hypothetical protein